MWLADKATLLELQERYSVADLFVMLEMLDLEVALNEQARKDAEAEAKRKARNKGR